MSNSNYGIVLRSLYKKIFKMYIFICIYDKIKQKELSEKTKIPLRTVKRNIEILKEEGYIERVGSKKTGYWNIKK